MVDKSKVIDLLLIEDDEWDLTQFQSFLIKIPELNIRVTACESLGDGLKCLADSSFDLVISDLDLPDADGLDAIEILSAQVGQTPILVLTGAEDDSFLERSAHLGVYDYLYKADLNERYLKRSLRYALSKFQMNEKNRNVQEQLIHSQKMEAVGHLTGGIAHDFNNKLAIIQANVDLLQPVIDAGRSPEKNIKSIHRVVGQATQLTSQLLAFSRKQQIRKEVVELNPIISGAIGLLGRLVHDRIQLKFAAGSNLYHVDVDTGQLDQVIMNLVINARDAIADAGEILISTEKIRLKADQGKQGVGDFVRLTIRDSGKGIPSEIQDKIFDPFFTTKEEQKGTGLGLSVVHGIVQQHGGFIEFDSTVDQGTEFQIYLPKADRAMENIAIKRKQDFDFSNLEILYVEDEPELRDLMASVLAHSGIEVVLASDGEEALSFLENQSFDLVITDMVMPKMSGKDLFEKVREKTPDLPFLFLSGYSPKEIAPEGIFPKATQFLRKPCSVPEMLESIGLLLQEVGSDSLKKKLSEAS